MTNLKSLITLYVGGLDKMISPFLTQDRDGNKVIRHPYLDVDVVLPNDIDSVMEWREASMSVDNLLNAVTSTKGDQWQRRLLKKKVISAVIDATTLPNLKVIKK